MAPISLTIFLAAFVAMVSAMPMVAVRQAGPSMVTVSEWTTVDVPVTLWVDQNGNPLSTVVGSPTPAAPAPTAAATTPAPQAPAAPAQPASPSTTLTTMTTASVNAQAVQPAPPAASSSSSVAAPAPAPVAASSSPPAAAYTPPASSAAPAPAPASSSTPASTGVSGIVEGTSTNDCVGTGAACQGDITYYTGGLGACGWQVNTDSAMVIALPWEFMGEKSNDNPYCNQPLTIQNPNNGQTIQAVVGDKCMGCVGRSIDLTEALFNAIGGGCNGRCSGFNWWFNNPIPGLSS